MKGSMNAQSFIFYLTYAAGFLTLASRLGPAAFSSWATNSAPVTWGLQSMSNKYIHDDLANSALLIMTENAWFCSFEFLILFSHSPCWKSGSWVLAVSGLAIFLLVMESCKENIVNISLSKPKQPLVLQCCRNRWCVLQKSRYCVGSTLCRKALISGSLAYRKALSTGVQNSKQPICILGPGPQGAAVQVQSLDSGGGREGCRFKPQANAASHLLIRIPSSPHGNLFGLSCNAWWEVFSPLSRHPWLFCFILCAASYFILSTSFPSLHRYYRHAKAGWEGHNDLCLMLLPRLLRGAEGETLPLTTPSPLPALPTTPLHRGMDQSPHPPQGICREAQCI